MLSVGYKRIKGNSKMKEIVKNCLNIIREQKEKINFLEVQTSQLNTLLETQTKLLIEYASFYRGEARYMYIQELQNMLDYDCLDNNIEIEYAE